MNVKNSACIRRLSFRSLLASRRRNGIAIAAITLTTLLFTSLFTIALSIQTSFEQYTFRQIGGYSHGTFKEVSDTQAQAIAAHPNVKAAGLRTVIGIISSGVFAKTPAEVSYMDENCTAWSFAAPSVGRMPENDHEISMDTKALQLLGIEPELGAKIPLTYCLADSVLDQERTDTFILTGYWEYDEISPVHYINISRSYADAVAKEVTATGKAAFRSDLNVMMKSTLDIRKQMEEVDTDLGYTWDLPGETDNVRIGVNWGYTTAQLAESSDPMALLSICALVLLVIVTGYLIIYNIFQISVAGDIRFYGLLKTIGVTPRQLRRIIRQQAFCLCIIGIPTGLLLGYLTGVLLTPIVLQKSTTLNPNTAVTSHSILIFAASAAFALFTVFLSCRRPARLAAKVSPVEAVKYTDAVTIYRKKPRVAKGSNISKMALANLGRNRLKTLLVLLSLSLSVLLFHTLVILIGGFDTEKYLEQQSCADFIVSTTDYFQYSSHSSTNALSADTIRELEEALKPSLSGCGYSLDGESPQCLMSEESLRLDASYYLAGTQLEQYLASKPRYGDLLLQTCQIEGFDEALFQKLTLLEGDLTPLKEKQENQIALAVSTDDYGNISHPDYYPPIGSELTVSYVEEGCYIDNRTGALCDENTPEEFVEYKVMRSHDITYTICAYVIVPNSISHRYSRLGYSLVLPVEALTADSLQAVYPLFYLADTPDAASEQAGEAYLNDLCKDDLSGIMYESKASLRTEFENFRQLFLLLGGLLCGIVGLVGILNFFNTIMTGILSRRREFAILQSIGMTSKQLRQMLILEGSYYTMGSAFLALILCLLLKPLGCHAFESMFWFFRSHFTLLPVLALLPFFALLGVLIPCAAFHRTGKVSLTDRLRECN